MFKTDTQSPLPSTRTTKPWGFRNSTAQIKRQGFKKAEGQREGKVVDGERPRKEAWILNSKIVYILCSKNNTLWCALRKGRQKLENQESGWKKKSGWRCSLGKNLLFVILNNFGSCISLWFRESYGVFLLKCVYLLIHKILPSYVPIKFCTFWGHKEFT